MLPQARGGRMPFRRAEAPTCRQSVTGEEADEAVARDVRHDPAVTTEPGRATGARGRPPGGPVRRWTGARPADLIDFFVYVVVLNLAIEYVPSVISETFTLSLLTAALLKISLEVVIWAKGRILVRFRAAQTPGGKAVATLSLWVVAAGSKFVVLTLVDLIFGGAVSLGGFVPVTLLIVALMLSRAGVRRLVRDSSAGD